MAGSGSADPALHFLPAVVRGRLRGGAIAAPEEERFPAALAFVDISGFSKLSDELSSCHGAEGAELLQQWQNSELLSHLRVEASIAAALIEPPDAGSHARVSKSCRASNAWGVVDDGRVPNDCHVHASKRQKRYSACCGAPHSLSSSPRFTARSVTLAGTRFFTSSSSVCCRCAICCGGEGELARARAEVIEHAARRAQRARLDLRLK